MGRSIETPTYAEFTVYLNPEEPFGDSLDWSDYREDISCLLQSYFPSLIFGTARRYPGSKFDRETIAVAANDHGVFTLAEYCGLVALSFVVDDTTEHVGLSERWAQQAYERLQTVFPERLAPLATMSNGETVYQRMGA